MPGAGRRHVYCGTGMKLHERVSGGSLRNQDKERNNGIYSI